MLSAAIGNDTLRFFIGICIALLEFGSAVTIARIHYLPATIVNGQLKSALLIPGFSKSSV
jgi:hypothetical protein